MIPQKIQLHNFLSYGETKPLDFRGLELACLTGANGVGKSSLLEAITWSLWGKSRAPSDDDLIRHDQSQMWVDFEFKLGRTIYRVIRKRSRQGRGQSSLDFMVQDKKSSWKSIAGATKNNTQAVITDTLKTNYETFVNSAFLRQGRADEFTIKKPQERKKVLADILNLAYYDQLSTKAKDKLKELTSEENSLKQQIEYNQEEITDRKKLTADAKKIRAGLRQLHTQIKEQEKELKTLQKEKTEQEKDLQKAKNLDERLQIYQKDIEQLEKDFFRTKKELDQEKKFKQNSKNIEVGYKKLLQLRQKDEKFNSILSQRNELLNQQSTLKEKLSDKQTGYKFALEKIEGQIQSQQNIVDQKTSLSQKATMARKKLVDLKKREEKLSAIRKEIRDQQNNLASNKLMLEQITANGQKIKARIQSLQSLDKSDCPLCEQKLTDEHRHKVISQLEKERSEERKKYKTVSDKIDRGQKKIKKLEQQENDLRKNLVQQNSIESKLLHIQDKLKEIKTAGQELKKLEQEKSDLQKAITILKSSAEYKQLGQVKKDIAALKYDSKKHQTIKDKLLELGNFVTEKNKLDQVEIDITRLQQDANNIVKTQQEKGKLHKKLFDERQSISLDKKMTTQTNQALHSTQNKLDALRSESAQKQAETSVLQDKLSRLQTLSQEVSKQKKRLKKIAIEISQYEELVVAFGKRGIQAMIIETALPELENEANKLLGKMTDGRMQVRFLTQRQKKTSADVMETLDIIINDEMGVKHYELFSGGEAFRINFAIRIALSKLLAHRAGARLQFLVIDEGFGTQDAAGRESLIEAINSISNDFAKILVITHIKELRDAFSTRIDVMKDQTGSHYEVVG